MKKIITGLKAIYNICRKPSLLYRVINTDEQWKKELLHRGNFQNGLKVIPLKAIIGEKKVELNTFTFLGGGSLPTDLILLKSLAQTFSDCQYFEIGTWRGESVINVSEIAQNCYTLNLSKKEILDLNLPNHYAKQHGILSNGKSNIIHITGNSSTFDFKGLNKRFDLIFIDGDHHYEMVKSDTINVFEHLVHKDSIVVWHDYAYNPEKLRPEVLCGILDGLPKELHSKLYHVSNTMCAIYTNIDFPNYSYDVNTLPNALYTVSVQHREL